MISPPLVAAGQPSPMPTSHHVKYATTSYWLTVYVSSTASLPSSSTSDSSPKTCRSRGTTMSLNEATTPSTVSSSIVPISFGVVVSVQSTSRSVTNVATASTVTYREPFHTVNCVVSPSTTLAGARAGGRSGGGASGASVVDPLVASSP